MFVPLVEDMPSRPKWEVSAYHSCKDVPNKTGPR